MIDFERTMAEAHALATENEALRSDARTRARLLQQLIEERDAWKRRHAEVAHRLESARTELTAARSSLEHFRQQAVTHRLEKLHGARQRNPATALPSLLASSGSTR